MRINVRRFHENVIDLFSWGLANLGLTRIKTTALEESRIKTAALKEKGAITLSCFLVLVSYL